MQMSLRSWIVFGVLSLVAPVASRAGSVSVDNSAPVTFVNGTPTSSNSLYCPTGQAGCSSFGGGSLGPTASPASQMSLSYADSTNVVPVAGYVLWTTPSVVNSTSASSLSYTAASSNQIVQLPAAATAPTTSTYASFAGTFSMPGTQLVNNQLLTPGVTTDSSSLVNKYNPGLILTNPSNPNSTYSPADVTSVPEPSPALYLLGALPFLAVYGRRFKRVRNGA